MFYKKSEFRVIPTICAYFCIVLGMCVTCEYSGKDISNSCHIQLYSIYESFIKIRQLLPLIIQYFKYGTHENCQALMNIHVICILFWSWATDHTDKVETNSRLRYYYGWLYFPKPIEIRAAMPSCGDWFTHPWKWLPDRTRRLCVWVTLCTYNGSMRCMLPWELRCVLGGNRSESGIIMLYSASEQDYLVLALYKHALLLYINTYIEGRLHGLIRSALDHRSLPPDFES